MLKNRTLKEWMHLSGPGKWIFLGWCLLWAATSQVQSAQPVNNDFATRTVLSGASGSTNGDNLRASFQFDEQDHGGPGGASVWYEWTAPDTGIVTFDTFGSDFDTLLAAYSGFDLPDLQQLAANDDSGPGLQSRISFSADAGQTYFIAVDGFRDPDFGPAEGIFTLNWKLPTLASPNPPPAPDEIQLSALDYVINENSPGGTLMVTVQYGGGSTADVSVEFQTIDGTAFDGVDYNGTRGTLTFVGGDTTPQTFFVQVNDDSLANGPRTFIVALQNPTDAVLNSFDHATVTILDDETPPSSVAAGAFSFSSTQYRVTENESITSPFPNIAPRNNLDVPGALITVNRLGGSVGKVLVDYTTVDDLTAQCGSTNATGIAVPDCDYTPTSGTLIFLNGQTSTNFLVSVRSDRVSNSNKVVQIALSNPRAAPQEDPNLIVPSLGAQNTTGLLIQEINTSRAVSIERATYTVLETQAGINLDVILPFGATGGVVTVQLSTEVLRSSAYAFSLLAGSDYTDPETHSVGNPRFTDGASAIVNTADYVPITTTNVTFPAVPQANPFANPGTFRQHVFIPIIDDDVVEFNEDILVFIHDVTAPQNDPVRIGNAFANATILFDDQPAGAADRTWNPELISGTTPPFNPVPGANNTVQAVVVQPDQKTLIGGNFTDYNGVSRNRIARINRNGSLDTSFNPGSGADGFVSDIAIYSDPSSGNNQGKIVAAGGFTSFNNIQRNGIARLNSDGSLDTTFNPGAGANGPIRSLAILSIGKIVIGGDFTAFNGVLRNGIARLNDDGSLDQAFDPGAGTDGTVWSVGLDEKSTGIQVSQFGSGAAAFQTNIDSRANSGIVSINFVPECVPNSLHVYYGATLIFDSGLTNVDCTIDRLAPIRYVIPYGPGPATDITIVVNEGGGDPGAAWQFNAFIENAVLGERVVIGGDFHTVDGFPRSGIARLLPNGAVDQGFDPGGGTDNSVFAVRVQPDSKVLIGGAFTDVDFHARSKIARLNENGSIDSSFDPGDGFNNSVFTIKLQSDGKPVLGGLFTRFDSVLRMGIARLFVNGVLDTSFMDQGYNQFAGLVNPFSFEPDNFVNSIAIDGSGGVMIGGSFTNVGGNRFGAPYTRQQIASRYNIARLIGGYTPGPGNMQFQDPEYSYSESGATAFVRMERIDGRLGTVRENESTADRLAQAGQDYTARKGSVVWSEGAFVLGPISAGSVAVHLFSVPIIDDLALEGDEIFDLFLRNASGSINLGGEVIPLGGARARASAPVTITDNDFNHGVIAFSAPTYSVSEGTGTATVTLIRTNGSDGLVTVQAFTRDGTARGSLTAGGGDYVSRNLTVTFAPGQTNASFSIQITDDLTKEFDETVFLVLTNAVGGASLPGGQPTSTETAVLTIIDNDFSQGRLNFSATNYVTSEGAGSMQVTVTRTGGNVGAMNVSVAATNGTATAGQDFVGVTNFLSWASGDTTPRTFTIPLLQDAIVEGDETINLRLFNPSVTGSLGSRTTATVTISDDDSYGQLEFSQANYEAAENGTNITITVVRKGGTAGTVSVDFAVDDGTAVVNADYTTSLITSSTLTFAPGETSKTFRIGLLDDDETEGPETVLLSLLNPINASLGANSTAILTIIDDEFSNVPAGSVDTTFDPLLATDEPVYTLTLQPDGKILIGGDFTTFNHITRHRVARLLSTGALDPTFNQLEGPNRSVRSMALQPDGKVVIGGFFTSVAGTNRNHIARLSKDGTVDGFFNPGAGADNPVFAVALLPDGQVAIGGSFNTFNGVTRQGVALLHTNGVLSLDFNPGLGANGTVYAIAVQPDGKIVIGGDFSTVNNIPRPGIARLNPDGSVDLEFTPGAGTDGPVRALALQPDGAIIIGGSFTHVDSASRNYLARLNPDGSVDSQFMAAARGGDSAVYALALQADGKIIAAGDFTMFNGVHRSRLTRLNPNGETDPTINFGAGANSFIAAVAVQLDSKLVIGGAFTAFDGITRNHVARLHGGSLAGPGRLEFADSNFTVSEASGVASVTLRRKGGTVGSVSIDVSVSSGTATSGSDFLDTNAVQTVVFQEGETYATYHIQILDDTVVEGPETANLTLANAAGGAVIGEQPDATLTIISDDSVIGFLTATYSVNENIPSGNALISVIRTGATNTSVSVDYKTDDGTAVSPADYLAVGQTLTFAPGEVLKTFAVPIRNDTNVEGNETLFLRLTNATAGTVLSSSAATLTIVDDDFAKGSLNFSSAAYTVNEYETNVTITIVRSGGSSEQVTVNYATRDGTAQAGQDYTAASGIISFADGETIKTFTIPITPDYIDEIDETVILVLSDPHGGAILGSTSTATLTIVNNTLIHGSISLAQANYLVSESNAFVNLTITRTLGFLGPVSVSYQTISGSALSGVDFVGVTNSVSWADGDNTPRIISIPLINDTVVERVEDFAVVLSNPQGGATLGARPLSTITIRDDDQAAGKLSFDQASYTISEGATNAIISVIRTFGETGTVSVVYATVPGGSAVANVDYTNVTGTLTFLPGETNKSFTIPIVDNFVVDVNKSINLRLSNPTGGAVTNGQIVAAVLTIVENDQQAGSIDASFNNSGANAQIYAALLQTNNNKIYLGGDFNQFSGTIRGRVTRLNPNGVLDSTFDTGGVLNNSVRALALQPDNKLLVGGLFTAIAANTHSYLMRFQPDGTVDTNFLAGLSGVDNAVYSLAVQADGKILIGGLFNTVNGVARNFIVRVTPSGTIDSLFSPQARTDGAVRAIVIQSDGRILLGGDFALVNGVARKGLARLNQDGTLDTGFDIQAGPNASVYALAVQSDGKILVGGSFSSFAGTNLAGICRLLANGAVDSAFNNAGTGTDEFVSSIALQPDGKIVVGGGFTTYNGITRNRLVRLTANGALDPNINFGEGANSYVSALALQPDKKIIAGGAFTLFDGVPRNYVARLNGGDNLGFGSLAFSATNYNGIEGTNLTIQVKRSVGLSNTVTVAFATSDGTATSQDYVPTNGVLTFAQGEIEKTFTVSLLGDTRNNGDRTVNLTLSAPGNGAALGIPSTATLTILNDDGLFAFTVGNFSVSENAGNAVVTVDRLGSSVGTATVEYNTTGGTATPNTDYIPVTGVLTFTNGQAQQSILVPIIDDTLAEGNETVQLTLSNPSINYALGLAFATLTIVDNELSSGTIEFTTNSFAVSEKDGTASIQVVRKGGSSGNASVQYFTADGSATSPADYTATSGTLVFADGETSKTFKVPIIDDTLIEGAETVNLTLGNATGATLGLNSALLTILSDETVFSFTNQFVVSEGAPFVIVQVNRSTNGSGPVSVQANTFDGTATAGLDYVSVNTNLTWVAGDFAPKEIVIPIIDDSIGEPDETFTVELINPTGEAQIDPNSFAATVIIRDNDSSFTFDAPSYNFSEAIGTATINVRRVGVTNGVGSVQVLSVDGTATTAAGDYFPIDLLLTFGPGESTRPVTIQIGDDAIDNGNRDFVMRLQNPVGANLGNPSAATVTIVDDERLRGSTVAGQFSFTTNSYLVTELEGDTLSTNFFFTTTTGFQRTYVSQNHRDVLGAMVTVNRLGGSKGKVLVDYSTVDITTAPGACGILGIPGPFDFEAIPGCDYVPVSGTLVFDNLQTSTNFVVPILTPDFIATSLSTNRLLFFKSVPVVLSNPRPAPEEDPNIIAPTLDLQSSASVDILQVQSFIGFNFGRFSHRIDERDQGQPTRLAFFSTPPIPATRTARVLRIPILLPSGAGGSVRFIARRDFTMDLEAGSDNALGATNGLANRADFVFPNPGVSDGSPIITNAQDFILVNTTINIARGDQLVWAEVPILDDPEVEFNEDIELELIPLANNPIVGWGLARATILFDDQPAGAVDREWNPSDVTNSIPQYNTAPGANNVVHATAIQDDQKTIIGGDFTAYNSIPSALRIARINPDGGFDTSFRSGLGANDSVNGIAIYRSANGGSNNVGKIIVVGGFSSFDGAFRNRIARLNSDGSLDPTYLPGDGADQPIQGVTIQADGKVVVVGQFTIFNGVSRPGIARLNDDGSLDETFNPDGGADAQVMAVDLVNDGTNGQKIVIGGAFSSFAGVFRNGIARVNPDGSLDTTFDPGGGSDGPVFSLAVQPDGKTIIGGFFTDVDFRSRNSIARLNPNGTLDVDFDPGDGANSAVYSVVLEADGKAMIGGVFTSYNQTRRLGLARLLFNGTLDTSFLDTAYNQFAGLANEFSFQPPNFVRSISFQTNGDVMIAGSFTKLGGNFADEINRVPGYTNIWTRQNKVTRYNVARLIGGYTPGPGNTALSSPTYPASEDSPTGSPFVAINLSRTDGRLGSVAQTYVTGDRLALAGSDYIYSQSNSFWRQQGYHDLFGFPQVPQSVGYSGPSFFYVPIIDDRLIEGNELFNVNGLVPSGSINLGGEIIPLGTARGAARAVVTIADNDVQHGTLMFASRSFTVSESNSTATITVIRTNGSNGSVSVDYFARNGPPPNGATNELDYTLAPGTLNFQPGETVKTFPVTIRNDTLVEPLDEVVLLVLTNATGGADLPGGTPTSSDTAQLIIVDDDFPSGYANFSAPNFVAYESNRVARIMLTRRGSDLGTLTMQAVAVAGTADASDFTAGVTNITWANGDSAPKFLVIPLVDDNLVKSNRTILVSLQNGSPPGSIGLTNSAVVTIIDNDAYGVLEFSRANYEAEENGTNAIITVVRNNGITGTVTVDIGISNITATAGSDYTTNLVPRRLTFAPGERTKTFAVGLLDDTNIEGLETIGLALMNPSLASLGFVSNAIVSIIDDEELNTPAGSPDTTFDVAIGPNGAVYNLALQRDGKIVIGGAFNTVDHVIREHLARLLPNGSLDPNYNAGAGSGVNREIRSIVIQDDGKTLIGGLFTVVQGTNFNHLARLNNDGTVDAFFNPGAGADNPVYALALLPNGQVVAGGSFVTFNGALRPGIVLLNTNGTLVSSFKPGVGFNGTVFALAVQPDGKILAGGDFTTANNIPRIGIARLNPDGSVDETFDPGAGADGTVRAIAVQADGRILIGGSFTHAGGLTRNHLARLQTDGSLDANFLAGPNQGASEPSDAVYALGIQFDGKIIVGGDFTHFNGVTRGRITRLTPDGLSDPTINFGSGGNGAVNAVALQEDRRIVLGGAFTQFNDADHHYVVRLYGGSIAGPGAFQFGAAVYDANEFDGQAIITVKRIGGTRGEVQVDYLTSDGTATAGLDYTAAAGSLNFPEGEVKQTFIVPIFQDTDVEPTETVNLALANPSAGTRLGFVPVATLNIISDDSHIGFLTPTFAVSEAAPSGHATITLIRTDATNSSVSVDVLIGGGTAINGADYLSPTLTNITFAPGESLKSFQIGIINDTNVEPAETVFLALTNAVSSGSVYYSFDSAVLSIINDDFAFGVVGFSQSEYGVRESQTNCVVTVNRVGGSDGIVSVDYVTRNGTALAPLDYTASFGTLTFTDGETTKTFAVPIIFDTLDEGTETVFVSLSNVRGGATLSLTNATIIITNTPAADGIRIVPAGAALVQESGPVNGAIDAGETVTFNFGLRNVGVLDASRVGATLLSTNGITALTTSNYFGEMLAGGHTVSRPYQFRVDASNSSRITLVFRLQDGALNLGTATFDMFVGATTITFSNTNGIIINDSVVNNGRATPFPSAIPVSGLVGTVAKVSVTLSNINHTYPADIDIMLVGPHGESVVLLSDAGSTSANPNPINNVTLRFDDDVGQFVSHNGPIVSGTYQPINYTDEILGSADFWPSPVPANAPTRTRLLTPGGSTNSLDPNGVWQLFVVDDAAGDVGSIAGGWSVTLTMTGSGTPSTDLGASIIVAPNQTTIAQDVNYTISVTNYGPAKATGVILSDLLDPGTAFLRSQGTYTQSNGLVTIALPDLASGAGTNVIVTARANPANPAITNTLFNLATVRADQTDPNSANDSAIGKVVVYPFPQVAMIRKAGQVVLSWPGLGGTNYIIEATDNLVPANWIRMTNNVPTLSAGVLSITLNPAKTNQFFRIRTP